MKREEISVEKWTEENTGRYRKRVGERVGKKGRRERVTERGREL
jgi:hypothetical protein